MDEVRVRLDQQLGSRLGDQPDARLVRLASGRKEQRVFGAEQLRHLADTTLLVNVSNDGWFGESIAIPQHLQIARVRAAEAGRYLVRAANRGITAVIDPRGRLVETIEPFRPGLLRATVRGYTGATPYARVGNYLIVALCAAALAATFAPARSSRPSQQ